jgi:hypothetical protein
MRITGLLPVRNPAVMVTADLAGKADIPVRKKPAEVVVLQ